MRRQGQGIINFSESVRNPWGRTFYFLSAMHPFGFQEVTTVPSLFDLFQCTFGRQKRYNNSNVIAMREKQENIDEQRE